jgi:geranylgeranyl pyrophosphate synthase
MGSGRVIVLDDATCMVNMARFFLEFTADESCGKCVPCRVGTQMMLAILNRIVAGEGTEQDLVRLTEIGDMMKNASLCALGQTAPNPVLSTLRYFPDEYLAHIEYKTGHLFAAAAAIPALLAGQKRHYGRLHRFGLRFGVFFQILDDLQDFAAREEEAGKPVMHDLEEGKLGLPVILLLKRVRGRERKELLNWLGDAPRRRFDILERMRTHGILVETRELARARAIEACKALTVFPASPAKALLISLPERLLSLPAFARLS